MKKRILIVQRLKDEDQRILSDTLGKCYDLIFPSDYSDESLARLVRDTDICLGTSLSDTVIECASQGLVFQSIGTGVDKLNLAKMKERQMVVCNSHSHSKYVAEFAVSLLLSLVKKIHLHDRMMRQGTWWRPSGQSDDVLYLSDTILNRRIGFIGFGCIGQNIARMLSGFDVSIGVFDMSQKVVVQGCPSVEYRSKEAIVSESDILFITVPLTAGTEGLIGQSDFRVAKDSSLWVHISRGPVVVEQDLYNALIQHDIAGVAIDNWFGHVIGADGNKYPSELPFHTCDNVLMSPYRAIYVKGMSPHLEDAVRNLEQYAQTGDLFNQVNLAQGY